MLLTNVDYFLIMCTIPESTGYFIALETSKRYVFCQNLSMSSVEFETNFCPGGGNVVGWKTMTVVDPL